MRQTVGGRLGGRRLLQRRLKPCPAWDVSQAPINVACVFPVPTTTNGSPNACTPSPARAATSSSAATSARGTALSAPKA